MVIEQLFFGIIDTSHIAHELTGGQSLMVARSHDLIGVDQIEKQ